MLHCRIHHVYYSIITTTVLWFAASFIFLLYHRFDILRDSKSGDKITVLAREAQTFDVNVYKEIHSKLNELNRKYNKRSWLANYERIDPSYDAKGPGENGVPVKVNSSMLYKVKEGLKVHGFNIFASNIMSLHRRVPDGRSKG